MPRSPTPLRHLAPIALALAVSLTPLHGQQAGIAVGSKAPDVEVLTLDGEPVSLADQFGETPVILEFWATWCPLCRALEPAFAELEAHYGESVRVVRVGVPENQSREQQRSYVERRGLGGVHLFDPEGSAYRAFSATHTSYVVVVDADGRVTYTGVGKDQDLRAAVATALEPPPEP